jgi:hypothetical protein
MGFWETLGKTVEVAGKLAHVYTVSALAQDRMTRQFSDLEEIEQAVGLFVAQASAEQLRSMDAVLRSTVKTHAFRDSEFQRAMWLFASLHGAWSVRNASHGR